MDGPSLVLFPNYVEEVFNKLIEISKGGYVFEVGRVAIQEAKENLLRDTRFKEVFIGD